MSKQIIMDAELLYQYNPWWEDGFQMPEYIPRLQLETKLYNTVETKAVTLLTGLRRIGKTTLMKRLIQYLLNNNIQAKHIFYISCDDYLLRNHSVIDLVDEYRKLHRLTIDKKIYVFFDEIATKENFRLQLKNLYDKQNTKIYASSSSSSALRDQRGYLTGRESIIEVSPLTFHEFLTFRKIQLKKADNKLVQTYFEVAQRPDSRRPESRRHPC